MIMWPEFNGRVPRFYLLSLIITALTLLLIRPCRGLSLWVYSSPLDEPHLRQSHPHARASSSSRKTSIRPACILFTTYSQTQIRYTFPAQCFLLPAKSWAYASGAYLCMNHSHIKLFRLSFYGRHILPVCPIMHYLRKEVRAQPCSYHR